MEDLFEKVGQPVELNDDGSFNVAEEAGNQEEKVEQTESKTDEKVESTEKTEKTEEKVETTEKTEESPSFSFDSFKSYAKEKWEREIESEDDLKTYFDKAAKADEYQSEFDKLNQEKAELADLVSKTQDPMNWFASKDEFIRNQFLKNNGDKFSESAMNVLTNLSPDKIKSLNPKDAIKVSMLVDNPDLEESEINELIEEEYGIEDEDQTAAQKGKLKIEANKSKKTLAKLYDGIELPKAVDIESMKTELKESWSTPLKEVVDGITELKMTEDFSFAVTDDMKDGMIDSEMNQLLANHTNVSEEAASEIAGKIRTRLFEKNADKIMKVYADQVREKAREEWRKEVHNDKDLNNDVRTGSSNDGKIMSGKEFMDSI